MALASGRAGSRSPHSSRAGVASALPAQRGLRGLIAETGADELIVASAIFDHSARLRSYELLAQSMAEAAAAA